MNRLFVGFKPSGVSSANFLNSLKKKYKAKKAGYSGTLDPFAKGVVIVAFGAFTKLFRFLQKSPKSYECTIWLGAKSLSFDTQNITKVEQIPPFSLEKIEKNLQDLKGEIAFFPPQFSAKRIEGKRAYEFAKRGQFAPLKKCLMQIYECELLHYAHPFLTLRLCVSEGAYIRSYAEILAGKLGCEATLSNLQRLSEGKFVYENEKPLNVLEYLNLQRNFLYDESKLENGTKLNKKDLKFTDEGVYFVEYKEYFSIIQIADEKVSYLLNKVEKC